MTLRMCKRPEPSGSRTISPPSPASISRRAVIQWLAEAGPGDWMIYHVGFLARDVGRQFGEELAGVAQQCAWEAESGRAILTQKRLGMEHYEYRIAIARNPRR